MSFSLLSEDTRFHPVEGPNRYATAVEASKESFPEGADTVIIATGLNWPDALAGGSIAGAYEAPILLVTDVVSDRVEREIARLGAKNAIILGGESAVPASVFKQLRAHATECLPNWRR